MTNKGIFIYLAKVFYVVIITDVFLNLSGEKVLIDCHVALTVVPELIKLYVYISSNLLAFL